MDTLFFWTSKLFWLVFSPGNLLVLLIAAAWLLSRSRWRKQGRYALTGVAVASLLLAFLPVGNWLLYPLEQRFASVRSLAQAPDGILVLGGSFSLSMSENRQQPHLNDTAERLFSFAELARTYPQARLVFTGGSGNPLNQAVREAELAEAVFSGLGLTIERLSFERESRNTFENARNTARMVAPQPQEQWLLVTSAFHMPRSFGVFCRQGWKLLPYPVDYRTRQDQLLTVSLGFSSHLQGLELALREWIGLLAYRLTDKTDRLLPGPRDICAAD